MLKPFAGRAATVHGVPVPDHDHHSPDTLAAAAGPAGRIAEDLAAALRSIAGEADPDRPPVVLIFGSLYLAGDVLSRNGEAPS